MTALPDIVEGLLELGLSAATVREILQSALAKKTSRIFLNDRQLFLAAPILDALGIRFFLSPQKYLFEQDAGKGGFSNSAGELIPESSPVGSFMVHMGTDTEAVLAAREADLAGDDRELGRILGIPPCCVDAFIRNSVEAAAAQNDFTLFACRSTSGRPDPWVVNCAQYFGYGLVSYFPCTMNCRPTSVLARGAARFLRDTASPLAIDFLRYQACSYLYTEYDGVYALLEQPRRNRGGWCYNPLKIEVSASGLLSEALRRGNRLVARSPSDFTICNDGSEIMTVFSDTAFLLFHDEVFGPALS